MTATPATAGRDDRLGRDVVCLNCGYNLRGTAHDGTCPECGMAVRVSLREDPLAAAPAEHLRILRRGAAVFTVGTVLALPLLLFGCIPAAVGAWMLTHPQPGRDEPTGDKRLRWAARALLASGALILEWFAVAAGLSIIVDRWAVFRLRTQWAGLDAVLIAGCGLFWMGLIALSAYLDGLVARAPASGLGGAVRSFRRQWLAGLAVIVAIGLAAQLADWIYQAGSVYLRWTAPAFAVVVAAVLLWLWAATIAFGVRLRRGLPSPADS